MATLTEVSAIARNAIKFGIIGLIVVMLIPVAWKIGLQIYLTLNPPPPPAPTVRYGKLPAIDFPPQPEMATPEYKLETISGGFPTLASQSKIYVVGINKSRLLALDRIKTKVKPAGFVDEPIMIDEQRYRFTIPDPFVSLIINVITGNFSYNYDWTKDEALKKATGVKVGSNAIADARVFLGTLTDLPEELSVNGSAEVKYLMATGSATLVPTENVYEANFVRVDLFRENLDKLKVVTAGGITSPVYVILSTDNKGPKKAVIANFQYSPIIAEEYSTYPLKGVQTAWNDLVAGKAFIANRPPVNNVTIREISLAYYESDQAQKFLQTVYVFKGDRDFMAYVPAITDEYIVK